MTSETLSEALQRIGLTHERDTGSDADRKHTIRNGKHLVGRYSAPEAWKLIREADRTAKTSCKD